VAEVLLEAVHKSFGKVEVLHDINLQIRDGEFVVFVGPSGCGKSTLLRMIAGLEDITQGECIIDGQCVNDEQPSERGIAMVFQSYALYPHMNLYENMAFAMRLAGSKRSEIDTAVRHAAKILHIEHLLHRKPKELSGGQRQRVAIGRAITRKPKVFLFDEPLSNLDAELRVKMRIEFAKLHRDLGATMIYVTHDQVEAMTLADKIVVLSAGHVEQVGTPLDLYHHPRNRFVAGFIGSPKMNFLAGRFVESLPQECVVQLEAGGHVRVAVQAAQARAGDAVTLGVRPEHLNDAAVSQGDGFDASVVVVEPMGDATYLYMEAPGCADGLTARMGSDSRHRPGDRLRIAIPGHECHLFDAAGKAFERTQQQAHRLAAA
jgi:multiple sugar transport system ATP-binding protein